eukprot:gene7052-7798_t
MGDSACQPLLQDVAYRDLEKDDDDDDDHIHHRHHHHQGDPAVVVLENEHPSFCTISNSFLLQPDVTSPVHQTLVSAASSGSYFDKSSSIFFPSFSDDAGRGREDDDDAWEKQTNEEICKQFYFTVPWSPQIYFTVRGSENFHIYLWIAKDLAWSERWYYAALTAGIAALVWCSVLVYHAYRSRCKHEMYLVVALVLWLTANFVWMGGEIINPAFGSRETAGHIMEAAIGWMLIYHFFIKPCRLLPRDKKLDRKYEAVGLHPPFSYFENWRQYEHLHTLLWLGKDLSWIQLNRYTWAICLVPTFLIGIDFIITTARRKNMLIDCVHYTAQLMWVIANALWALGEIFGVPGYGDDDAPHSVFEFSDEAVARCRWWSSWMLIAAYVPIVMLYCVWLPLTCMGTIKSVDDGNDF